MSFWGTLAKVGGFAAAPFTGGASIPIGSAIGGAIDGISKGTGNAAQAMASNRGTEAELMLNQNDALEHQLLARQQETRSARNDAYKNAQRGAVAYNFDPSKVFAGLPSNVPRIDVTGGTMGTPQAKAAGDELLKQSMNRLTQPDLQVNGGGSMPAYRNLWTDPQFQNLLKPGGWEKFFGITSAVSPFLGLMAGQEGGAAPQSGNNPAYGYNPQSSVVK
jgi:hypothetical protein